MFYFIRCKNHAERVENHAMNHLSILNTRFICTFESEYQGIHNI
ncbi:hypothetical protein HMPREF2534_01754 [Bacteroides thetaiotaomicron]|nr:hypothetical protein HMPREF2534_01754 [Bacteroides thetaiotaomicron]